MNRRHCLTSLAGGGLALIGGAQQALAAAGPTYRISAQQLHQVLQERFPHRYAAAGVLELQLQVPQLQFLPEQNRLGTELSFDVSGPALRRSHTGTIDLDFALRYEPGDQTIRAHQIRVESVRLPGLSREAAAVIDAYARASAERALLEVVLHQLRPQDLALANTMGFEPGSITVASDGLVIGFVRRDAR